MRQNLFWSQILFILPVAVLGVITNEWLRVSILVVALLVNFKIVYYEIGEWRVFLFGAVAGVFIELGHIYLNMQTSPGMFGIALWLPLLYGYGFVFIRRLGNLITNKVQMSYRKK
jgi:hypothetical protein